MGVSTLHHHFREMTGSSPLQFQKQLRLFEARRLMLMEGMDAASAAFATGYESATQFNREYRRQFGQPPRKDVAGLQELRCWRLQVDARNRKKWANELKVCAPSVVL